MDGGFVNKLLPDSNITSGVLPLSSLASGLQVHAQPRGLQTSLWLHLLCIQGSVCWVFFSLPSSYGRNFFFNSVSHRTQFHCPVICCFTSESPQSCSENEIKSAEQDVVPWDARWDGQTSCCSRNTPGALWEVHSPQRPGQTSG